MNLQTFINRPILSGVLSVFVVLLGIIGLGSYQSNSSRK